MWAGQSWQSSRLFIWTGSLNSTHLLFSLTRQNSRVLWVSSVESRSTETFGSVCFSRRYKGPAVKHTFTLLIQQINWITLKVIPWSIFRSTPTVPEPFWEPFRFFSAFWRISFIVIFRLSTGIREKPWAAFLQGKEAESYVKTGHSSSETMDSAPPKWTLLFLQYLYNTGAATKVLSSTKLHSELDLGHWDTENHGSVQPVVTVLYFLNSTRTSPNVSQKQALGPKHNEHWTTLKPGKYSRLQLQEETEAY